MEITTLLQIIIPALLVLATAIILLNKLLKSEESRRNFDLRKQNQSTLTPIRLRAYERLTLLLERTVPASLILSTVKPGMTNMELHAELLGGIRTEFSHNLSQQIYVSNEVWQCIKVTQESLLQLVNSCALKCNPHGDASELAELIIQVYNVTDETPTEIALEKIKTEVKLSF